MLIEYKTQSVYCAYCVFDFVGGVNVAGLAGDFAGTWAVRDGDVLAAAPAPSTLFLFGIGLAGFVSYAR